MRSIKGGVIGIKVVGSPSAPLGVGPLSPLGHATLVAWNYWKLSGNSPSNWWCLPWETTKCWFTGESADARSTLMVFTKSCELWLCIFDIKPKLAKPFCLGSSEKKLIARVLLMPSHGFKYFFFIIRWPQFGVLHDPLSSLYTGLSARIHNPWVSFCPPIDFLNHQMVILGYFGACFAQHQNTYVGSISYDIHTIYSKKGLLTPLTKDTKDGRLLPLAI